MKTPWQSFFGIKPTFAEAPEEETPGDADKLQVIANALNDLESRVAAIEEKLTSVSDSVDTIAEVVDTEEFAELRANIGSIVTNFSKLDKKVTTLPKRQFGDRENKKDKKFKFL